MTTDNDNLERERLRHRAERLWAEKRRHIQSDYTQHEMLDLIQELQIHQIELELQNEELQRTRDEVEVGLKRFLELYEFAPIGYMTLGENGVIRQINLTGASFLRTERKNIVNRRFQAFLPYKSIAGFNQFLNESFKVGGRSSLEIILHDQQEEPMFALLEGEVNDLRTECRIAILDDTQRELASQSLQRNLSTNHALARLYGPLLSPVATLDSTAEVVLEEAKKLTDSLYGYVGTFNEKGQLVIHTMTSMLVDCAMPDGREQIVFRQNEDNLYPALWGHSLNTKSPHFTNEPHAHTASSGVPKGHVQLANFLSVPVLLGDALVGQIALSNKPGGYTGRDLEDIARIANYFALAVQRMQNKQSITASRDLMQNILTGIGAGIIQVDKETLLVEKVNVIALNLLGGTLEEYVGKMYERVGFMDLFGDPSAGCAASENKELRSEVKMERDDLSWISVQKTILEDTINGQEKYLLILFDITQKKSLERQLAIAQKLQSIGQLSAGVAHEINTPAQYVGQNLKFSKEAIDEVLALLVGFRKSCINKNANGSQPIDFEELEIRWKEDDLDYLIEELPQALSQSIEGVERITSIVRALKLYAHPGEEGKHPLNLNDAIKTACMVSRNEWKYYATVKYDLDRSMPDVPCVVNDIHQVLLNLIVNAAYALKLKAGTEAEKGTITFQTRLKNGWAEVVVRDTGIGIPEADLPRIFDPFFTTKPMGEGTGQGLNLVYSLITEKHAGLIDVESKVGIGTTMIVRLPIK